MKPAAAAKVRCTVCGGEIAPDGGVVLGALGRPIRLGKTTLGYHYGNCANVARGMIDQASRGAANALWGLFSRRAPVLALALQGAGQVVRRMREVNDGGE